MIFMIDYDFSPHRHITTSPHETLIDYDFYD